MPFPSLLQTREESVPGKKLSTLSRFLRTRSFKRTLRIRQSHGLELPTAASTFTTTGLLIWMRQGFNDLFMTVRGPQAHRDRAEALPPLTRFRERLQEGEVDAVVGGLAI
jgi:hypothetical protein